METKLNERSKQIRRDAYHLSKANGGYHYGGSFSCAEILLSLYDKVLNPDDKFILSKGHACWVYYVLLRERGLNPKLQGHPTLDDKNGVFCSTGSEGHGFPVGLGMAFARKINKKSGKIYVLVGDGECQEGTTWESLLTASFRKIDNLVIIVDYNKAQGAGYLKDILPIDGLGKVAETLGWSVSEIDGHYFKEIEDALTVYVPGKPRLIIANTVKGKGVSFMENQAEWHAKWPGPDHEKQLLSDLQ